MRPSSSPEPLYEIVPTSSNTNCPLADNFGRNIPKAGLCFRKAVPSGQDKTANGTPAATLLQDMQTAATGGNPVAQELVAEITGPMNQSLTAVQEQQHAPPGTTRTPNLSSEHQRFFDDTCQRCQGNCLRWLQILAETANAES